MTLSRENLFLSVRQNTSFFLGISSRYPGKKLQTQHLEAMNRISFDFTKHFVNFRNNEPYLRNNEPYRLNKREPCIVIRYWSRSSDEEVNWRYYRVTRDGLGRLCASTTFPWNPELEKIVDFSQVKSFKILTHESMICRYSVSTETVPDVEAILHDVDAINFCRDVEAIRRMNSLEDFSICCHYTESTGGPLKTYLLSKILPILANVQTLKRLKIKRIRFTDDDTRLLASFLSRTPSLDVLELDSCFNPDEQCIDERLEKFFSPFVGHISLKTLVLKDFMEISVIFDVGCSCDYIQYSRETLEETHLGLSHRRKAIHSFERMIKNTKYRLTLKEQKFTTRGPVSCIDFCDSTRTEWARTEWDDPWAEWEEPLLIKVQDNPFVERKIFREDQKNILTTSSTIKTLLLQGVDVTIPEIIILLTNNKSLEEMTFHFNNCSVDTRGFMQLVPHLLANTKLTSFDVGDSLICFREKHEVDCLRELIEKNTTLNRLILCSSVNCIRFAVGNKETFESFLRDIIRSMKKNHSLWQFNAILCGSTFFFEKKKSSITKNIPRKYCTAREKKERFWKGTLAKARQTVDETKISLLFLLRRTSNQLFDSTL